MLHFEFPFVHVFSKVDLLCGKDLAFNLEFYAHVQRPSLLVHRLRDSLGDKFKRLNELVCELVEDYGMLSFVPIAVEDKKCMAFLLHELDKASGFAFGTLSFNDSISETYAGISLDISDHLEYIEVTYLHREQDEPAE